MHKFINNQILSIFNDLTKKPDHKYHTNISQLSFHLKRYSLKSTKYFISIPEPKLWNDVINKEKKIFNLSRHERLLHEIATNFFCCNFMKIFIRVA